MEISSVFETALILPPGKALKLLVPVLGWMRAEKSAAADIKINAMLYGGRVFSG